VLITNHVPSEDCSISQAIVWQQWRANKMDDDQCFRDLVRCRDARAPQALVAFEYFRKQEEMLNLQDEIQRSQNHYGLRRNRSKGIR